MCTIISINLFSLFIYIHLPCHLSFFFLFSFSPNAMTLFGTPFIPSNNIQRTTQIHWIHQVVLVYLYTLNFLYFQILHIYFHLNVVLYVTIVIFVKISSEFLFRPCSVLKIYISSNNGFFFAKKWQELIYIDLC